ncbi:MAG: hypothetical protein J2O49_11270, partial [Sciscionella sp.]|nr:hypothetical protein [Sciscionella sp.]
MSETLKQLLLDPQRRPNVVNDCQQLIEDQVAAAAGIPGVAIKGGYKVVKAIKPGIIHDAVDGLLDQFVAKL